MVGTVKDGVWNYGGRGKIVRMRTWGVEGVDGGWMKEGDEPKDNFFPFFTLCFSSFIFIFVDFLFFFIYSFPTRLYCAYSPHPLPPYTPLIDTLPPRPLPITPFIPPHETYPHPSPHLASLHPTLPFIHLTPSPSAYHSLRIPQGEFESHSDLRDHLLEEVTKCENGGVPGTR